MDLSAYKNVVDFKNICRTCLNNQHVRQNIPDGIVCIDNKTISILDLLNVIHEVKLQKSYPDEICSVCLDQLCAFYKFKLQLEKSEAVLKKHLGTSAFESKFEFNLINDDNQFNSSSNVSNEKIEFISKEIKSDTEADIDLRSLEIPSNNSDTHIISAANSIEQPKTVEPAKEYYNDCDINCEDLINKINAFVCTTCNKTFKTKYILNVHLKRHKFKGQYLCTTCGKGFNSRGCLNRHMLVHTGEKKFQCDICNKRFPSSNNLNIHKRIHSGIKPYLCNLCGKSFTTGTGLNLHVRYHNKERPYACDICEKSFGAKNHLTWHRMIHTGERPFACNQCDKAFIKKCDLQRHEATHSNEKPFKCNNCAKRFSTKVQLHNHEFTHSIERPYECLVCSNSFLRRYYLRKHMLKHHPDSVANSEVISSKTTKNSEK